MRAQSVPNSSSTDTLVVKGGLLATDYAVFPGDIVIRGGKIVAILSPEEGCQVDGEMIDVSGKLVLPGGIDPHCHFRSETEDFMNGTMGAAAGGITTVIEMPQGEPPVTDLDSLVAKLNRARPQAVVDFGLWGSAVPDNLDQIPALFAHGVSGVKAFMPLSSILLEPSLPPLDTAQLWVAMQKVAEVGGVIGVHAENSELVCYLEQRMLARDRLDPAAHMEARSPLAEYLALEQAITLAEDTGAALHIVHLTIARGAARIMQSKERGSNVTAETCPSYLLMDSDDYLQMGPYAKVLPPLRSRGNVEELWGHVLREEIDFFASDHAPYTQKAVEAGEKDIWQAPNGVASNQVMLPMLLDEAVNRRGLSLDAFARLSSTNAARRFGLYPKKGTILPNSDADLAIYELNDPWTVDQEKLFSRQKRTPMHGRECKVRLERTLVRAMTVFQDGEICAQPGFGEFVKPLKRDVRE